MPVLVLAPLGRQHVVGKPRLENSVDPPAIPRVARLEVEPPGEREPDPVLGSWIPAVFAPANRVPHPVHVVSRDDVERLRIAPGNDSLNVIAWFGAVAVRKLD